MATHDDFTPGIIGVGEGRLGLNKYSDNDSDDPEQYCENDRINVRPFATNVPDPYRNRKSR